MKTNSGKLDRKISVLIFLSQGAKLGPLIIGPLAPLMTEGVIRNATEEAIYDRSFRIRANQGQVSWNLRFREWRSKIPSSFVCHDYLCNYGPWPVCFKMSGPFWNQVMFVGFVLFFILYSFFSSVPTGGAHMGHFLVAVQHLRLAQLDSFPDWY